MRYLILSVMLLLASGCISERVAAQPENGTPTTPPAQENATVQPPPPPLEHRYQAVGFSFLYPSNMQIDDSKGAYSGIFSGTHVLVGGQTGEMLLITYVDALAVYGANQDGLFKADPTTAASDLLEADMDSDPVGGILSSAYEVGRFSTFAIARDGIVAEAPFRIRFSDSDKSYYGYALDLYVPERSIQARVRIVALDKEQAESIKDAFLLSFRLE